MDALYLIVIVGLTGIAWLLVKVIERV